MSARSCEHCGTVDAPWFKGHRRSCPHRRPAEGAPCCPVCDHAARVLQVDLEQRPPVVEFGCSAGCDVSWLVAAADELTGELP